MCLDFTKTETEERTVEHPRWKAENQDRYLFSINESEISLIIGPNNQSGEIPLSIHLDVKSSNYDEFKIKKESTLELICLVPFYLGRPTSFFFLCEPYKSFCKLVRGVVCSKCVCLSQLKFDRNWSRYKRLTSYARTIFRRLHGKCYISKLA